MSESLQEQVAEILELVREQPEQAPRVDAYLTSLLAELRTRMPQEDKSLPAVNYKSLEVWKLLCNSLGEEPSDSEIGRLVHAVASKLGTSAIDREMARRRDLQVLFLDENISVAREVINEQ